MKETLKKGLNRILPATIYSMMRKAYRFFDRILSIILIYGGVIRLPYMVVSVGQACNFRCRDCGNFAPYSPEEFRKYKVEDIIESLNQILKNVTSINKLQIQGGEPFLYSDLPVLLEYLGNSTKRKIKNIEIATNGSIIPTEKCMRFLHMYNIGIRISDYGIAREKAKILIERCKAYGVRYYCYEFVNKEGLWYDCGGIETPREDNDKVVSERYKKCGFCGCLTLERGELSYCSRATNSYSIQNFNRKPMDYIKVTNLKSFRSELKKYIAFPHFMEACRYCNGTNDCKMVQPAIQMKH